MMSIALPFGVALFQANSIRLLNMATRRRSFVEADTTILLPAEQHGRSRDSLPKLVRLSYSRRTGVAIAAGMILQVCYF